MVNCEWSDWKKSLSLSCDITAVYPQSSKRWPQLESTTQCIVWDRSCILVLAIHPGVSHLRYAIRQRSCASFPNAKTTKWLQEYTPATPSYQQWTSETIFIPNFSWQRCRVIYFARVPAQWKGSNGWLLANHEARMIGIWIRRVFHVSAFTCMPCQKDC